MKKTKVCAVALLIVVAMMCMSFCFTACDKSNHNPVVDPIDDNYRVFYQVFVGSFSDSNGDGIGDLRGIINRMDYLNDGDINSGKSLGVQGIWLSPIFESPTYHKYDAKDYYKIDSKFGTEDDLTELIELCHSRNVKVILDLAINHTSIQNDWFVQFKNARQNGDTTNPYYDFYTCVDVDTKVPGRQYYALQGVKGSFYEANFDAAMPELNFDNQDVRNATVDIARHYLEMGVDGFRFDAIKYVYYCDTKKSAEFWQWYMDQLREIKDDIYAVGECWSADSEVAEYYPALNCFNFTTAGGEGTIAETVKKNQINTFTRYIENYLNVITAKNPDAMYQPFLANHDMDRASGFVNVSTGNAFMAANLYLLCSGSPTIYYGEEIGLKGTRAGSNTDANRRLAMLWGDGDTVEDPEGTTFDSSKQINGTVKDQLQDKDSLLNYYAKVIALRNKYPAIARGSYTALSSDNKYVGGFRIVYQDTTLGLIHNTSPYDSIAIPLPAGFSRVCDFIGRGDAKIENGMLIVGPQTSVIVM